MSTSGTTAWSMTAADMIKHALRENGIIALNETPTSSEIAACLVILNGLLRSWTPGAWVGSLDDLPITGGAASTTLDSAIAEVLSVRFPSGSIERELMRWGRSEYLEIPNKTQSGDPLAFYADDQRDAIMLYLWPIPADDVTLKYEYLRFPDVVTDQTQTVDFPQKYNEAMFTALAVRCAGIFGKQPPPELVARAQFLKQQMDDAERPESYIIETGLDW